MFYITENMAWPPTNVLYQKMNEHSVWYSGDASLIANFYSMEINKAFISTPFSINKTNFWSRQIKNQGEIMNHVPIAGDIAETSANLLFGESPIIKMSKENKGNQEGLDKLLDKTSFFSKMAEIAECSAAIGGVYQKVAWDEELSEYPMLVIEQADKAIPYFKFGVLQSVIFWNIVKEEGEGNKKIYRLLEHYKQGSIEYSLYIGSSDKLGRKIELNSIEETQDLEEFIDTKDILLAAYFPNMLPNKLNRASSLGRSDYLGVEGLMDSLDEIYSSWCREITLAMAKVYIPERYLKMVDGKKVYNPDTLSYVTLEVDPIDAGSKNFVQPQQFEIRADKFATSANNFLERIITSAGYSPQSFGLNIEGRAESGTALNIRERKSFMTKSKKEKYFASPMEHIIKCLIYVYTYKLKGKDVDINNEFSISFSDSITYNLSEVAESVNKLNAAVAISIETKIRMLHPEWTEEEIIAEVKRVKEENMIGVADNPDNFDLSQLDTINKKKEENEEQEDQVENNEDIN